MSNTDTDPTSLPTPQPQPQPQPPQTSDLTPRPPRALPPTTGNFLGNIGVSVPPGTSPTPQQGAPPPTWPPPFTPNRRQLYVPSQANRPTTDLGKPPRFPQQPDMWQVPGIYEGVGRQLGRWGGSQRTRLMAGNLSRFTNAYMQGSRGGQNEYTRIQHQRMTEAADLLQATMQSELQTYGAAYNSWASDPNALHSNLMDRATQLGDTEMQAALNLGPREAERLLQWRQAKLDDLSRANTSRKAHDAELEARNPWLVKPTGPDGLPTARLPLPKGIDPHGLSLGERNNVQLAAASISPQGFGQGRQAPMDNPEDEDPYKLPTDPRGRDDRGGDPDDVETFERGGQQDPATPEKLPPVKKDMPEPGTDADVDSGPEQEARRDGKVRLAQADTGTMSDAVNLPQINVKAEGDEEGDPTDVWDRVRINQLARQARERGGQGDRPSPAPTGPTSAQPPPPDQTQQRPGAKGQRGQGGPAGGPAQAPNQTVPPLGTAPETPPAKAPAPGVSPAADAARAAGQDPDFIEGMGAQWVIGQQTTSGLSRSGIPAKEREAILKRGTEIRNKMFEIVNDPNIKEGDKEAVLAAIDKQNPQIGAEIRGILNGSVTPRRDSPYWIYQLAHKADPSITQTTFQSRKDTLKYHTVGKGGENRIKLGTAIGHGYDLLNELEGVGKPGGVSTGNIWMEEHMPNIMAGKIMPETSAKVGALTRAAETFAREYNAVMSYTGPGTMTERKEMKLELDPQNPAKAIADIKKALDELKVRNAELRHNFETGWGGNYDAVMKQYDPAQAFPDSARGLKMIEGGGGQQGGVIDFRDLH